MKTALTVILIALSTSIFFTSCNKDEQEHSCYDKDLVHNGACTTDCPGVVGCDGKTYCNECEANRLGISVP